jgi:hypothetical protein
VYVRSLSQLRQCVECSLHLLEEEVVDEEAEEEEEEERLLLGMMHCTLSRVRALSPYLSLNSVCVRGLFPSLEEEEEEEEEERLLSEMMHCTLSRVRALSLKLCLSFPQLRQCVECSLHYTRRRRRRN